MKDRSGNRRWGGVARLTAFTAMMICGCTTLDRSECINADWRSIGYEDGARGYKASHIGSHRQACAKKGVTPDSDLYERGRRQGLLEWCTPRNGYRLGTRGKLYNGVCPPALASAFMEAINQGRAFRGYEKEVKKQEVRLKKMVSELDAVDGDIKAREAELVRDGISPHRRMWLLKQIRHLKNDQRYRINDIDDMERTLEDMRTNLAQMRSKHLYP